MIALDPKKLFRRLAGEIPKTLHPHVLIVGSLAAAYHYRSQLKTRAVNTKDADLIVHPAGDVGSCRKIAEKLLKQGWTRTDKCLPKPRPKPTKDLRVIRLNPPKSRDYFVEILGLPKKTQKDLVVWVPVRLSDGWYVIGCYRFMAVTSLGRLRSAEGAFKVVHQEQVTKVENKKSGAQPPHAGPSDPKRPPPQEPRIPADRPHAPESQRPPDRHAEHQIPDHQPQKKDEKPPPKPPPHEHEEKPKGEQRDEKKDRGD